MRMNEKRAHSLETFSSEEPQIVDKAEVLIQAETPNRTL